MIFPGHNDNIQCAPHDRHLFGLFVTTTAAAAAGIVELFFQEYDEILFFDALNVHIH